MHDFAHAKMVVVTMNNLTKHQEHQLGWRLQPTELKIATKGEEEEILYEPAFAEKNTGVLNQLQLLVGQ